MGDIKISNFIIPASVVFLNPYFFLFGKYENISKVSGVVEL